MYIYDFSVFLFTQMRESTSTDDIWLSVQEEGVALLEYSTMVLTFFPLSPSPLPSHYSPVVETFLPREVADN